MASNSNESNDKPDECEEPKIEYLKLISEDNQIFYIEKENAYLSNVLRCMNEGPYQQDCDSEKNVVLLHSIKSHVIEKLCLYLNYKARYMNATNNIPMFKIEPEVALDLLLAANFLDI